MGSKKKPKKSQAQIEAERKADMFNRQARASDEKREEILRNAGEMKADYQSEQNERAAVVRNKNRGRSSLMTQR